MNSFSIKVKNNWIESTYSFIASDHSDTLEYTDVFKANIKEKYEAMENSYHDVIHVLRNILDQVEELKVKVSAIGDAIYRFEGWIDHM